MNLEKERKHLMKNLKKGYIDLKMYQTLIGGLSVKYDERISKDSDPDPFGDGMPGLGSNSEDEMDITDEISLHDDPDNMEVDMDETVVPSPKITEDPRISINYSDRVQGSTPNKLS